MRSNIFFYFMTQMYIAKTGESDKFDKQPEIRGKRMLTLREGFSSGKFRN